jgi:hypothetical protein
VRIFHFIETSKCGEEKAKLFLNGFGNLGGASSAKIECLIEMFEKVKGFLEKIL